MLTIRIVNLFSRFVRPSVSKYESIVELTNDKSGILKMVDDANKQRLESTVENPHYLLEHLLKFKPQTIEHLKQSIECNAYSPINHKKHKIRMNIITREKQYDFIKDDIEDPYSMDLRPIQRHFSLSQKEVPIIDQYQIDSKSIMLFNLPDNVSQKDINESLHNFKVKSIKIGYCVLGLPAYAKVQLESESQVEDFKSTQRQYVEIGDRFCYIHTNQDNERLRLPNRMMVLHDLPQTETQNVFLQLAKYGRIMYFDHPSIIRKQLSLSEVKSIFANSNNPVKINVHKKDGTIESEYYPAEGQVQQINPFDNGFSENYFDFSKASSERFERKLQFAENINIYQNRVGEVQIVPRGYLIVTFSCAQEAQNCYFALKNSVKMDLLKSRYEFHFDRKFKERLLRFIDNEFLKKRINEKEDEVDLIKLQYKFGLSMMDQLVQEQYFEKGNFRRQPQEDNENDDSYAYKDYYNRLVELKKTIGKKTPHGKSFDELAEMELYGRMLPKYDPRQTLDLHNLDEKKPEHFSNMENPRLKGIPESRVLQAKQLRMMRKKTRIEKHFSKKQIHQQQIQGTALVEGGLEGGLEGELEGELDIPQIPQERQEDYKGKRKFSTFKTMPKVRKMTFDEIAHRSMKFNQFVRDTINEYLGIFSEQKLESNFSSDETKLINPHRVTFTDKTQFLTENQIPRVLEHHRNPKQAQMTFENHVQTLQIINSKQLNVDEVILKDINKRSTLSQIHLTDTGVVDQLFQVDISQGETVDQFIRKLNAVDASFGEEYRKVERDGQQYVAKIKKLEHIYPLDRVKNIKQFIQQADRVVTSESDKVALLEKHFDRMLSQGEIPEQVRQAFKHQGSSLDMDELFSTVGIEKGIWKKDLQMLMNLQKYREKDIQEDIAGQIEMEKIRMKQRPVKGTDYGKDPSNIDIRGEDGQFEVSKFKQV